MKTFKIFNLAFAKKLIDKGYKVVEVKPNRDKPWLNVYGFEDSEELRAEVERVKK